MKAFILYVFLCAMGQCLDFGPRGVMVFEDRGECLDIGKEILRFRMNSIESKGIEYTDYAVICLTISEVEEDLS